MGADSDRVETQLHLRRDPDARPATTIYANQLQANFTPEDFTLHFGYYAIPPLSEPPTGPVEVEVEPVARVVMPLNLMRNVIALLERQVSAYEQSFGAIPVHPNRPPWLTAAAEETES